jgi:gamma-glutamyl-gamma-aminobutyrate hydrolase PuuD
VITVADPAPDANGVAASRRHALYADAVARHGGEPILLSPAVPSADRRRALEAMDGLLLAGGVDIDPARYGSTDQGSRDVDVERDALEAEAWAGAQERSLPVLGICRGFQAINVFSGGRLLQDVGGHVGRPWGAGPALTHPLRVVPGTRLARVLFPTNVRGGVVDVNSYHHQAVRPADLAPGLVASGTASSPVGEIVEALETRSGRFVVGVQCHPERRESTPPAFDRLFRVFVDASRGAVASR